ncbi:MAG: disulfide bond formation protein B [Candidatus Zambryskibacteria bacterium]|nr:disulfide bond formation protein B [Candidatus Zambryskibacteria bacterium]
MTSIASIVTEIVSWGTLITHIVIILGIIVLFRIPKLSRFISNQVVLLGFLLSSTAFIGSLLYSNVIGFAPCELCWWQRIFLYPQVILFAIALYKERVNKVRDGLIFSYSLALSIIGALIALFQYYGQMFNPSLLDACATQGSSCAQLFFVSFGYITIPMMSLTTFLFLILLYFFSRRVR